MESTKMKSYYLWLISTCRNSELSSAIIAFSRVNCPIILFENVAKIFNFIKSLLQHPLIFNSTSIDFPLSNCSNSGIHTVGILTQYQPLILNTHVEIGQPWDLDRQHGGVQLLAPYASEDGLKWYMGTANAIYENRTFLDIYNPDYVLILSGDHIYKMDYSKMFTWNSAYTIESKKFFGLNKEAGLLSDRNDRKSVTRLIKNSKNAYISCESFNK